MISRRFCRVTAVCFAVFSSLMCGWAAEGQTADAGAVDLGVVPAATKVSVRLYLAPDAAKAAALDQFLKDVQDVTSPSYRHWLTPVEFRARFGASAAAVAQVKTFAENQGLGVAEVSASGLRVTVSGTATQMEAVFAPGLHAYQAGAVHAMANTMAPKVDLLPAGVVAVSGFDTVVPGVVDQLGDAVDVNAAAVVAVKASACLAVGSAERAAFVLEAKAAAAQGISVLAASDCATESFPADVTAVVLTPGAGDVATEARPVWQAAAGLPDDGLRHAPDLMVADVSALTQTLLGIAASMPASAGGRLGNVNATLYKMAPIAGVFSQTNAAATGTWEAATGLGLVNLQALVKYFPRGAFSVLVSGTATNYAPTHGQSTTLMSTVSDISGQGGTTVPTGTLTFMLSDTTVLGTVTLANGTGSLTTNTLPGGTNPVIVTYSGDANFSAGQGTGIYVTVLGEAAAITAVVGPAVTLGGSTPVAITVSSGSGVGTPSGTVTVIPQGVGATPPTYSAVLLKTANGTAGATVTVPALQAGAISLLVNCVSADLSFTCYSPVHATAVVKQATSSTTFTVTPNPPVGGTTTTFVATVTGAAAPAPAPTGVVSFYDNGALLGQGTLTAKGVATYESTTLTSAGVQTGVHALATTHAFTASYFGDVNYQASAAAQPGVVTPVATATTLAVSPNPPVTGGTTTLTATVAYASNGTAATGSVQFYQDAVLLGTGAVSAAGVATYSSTAVIGTVAHSFYALYPGDALYATSQSAAVTTQANTATVATTTSVAASTATVNAGSSVTLTASVVAATGTGATGTVSFTSATQGLLGSAALVGTTATLPVTLTTAGAQSITASYSGDATYKSSTSATPVVVTVASVTTPIVLVVAPATGAMYSNPVTAAVSVSGVATTAGAGPAGSVVFSVASAGSLTPITATVPISASSAAAGSAIYAFAAPAPGTYTVTATCTGTNFTCTAVPATASLVTVKGASVTAVAASPAALVAGATTTLTATIAAASALATSGAFTGTVTFYNAGGVALGMGTVTGNQASLTTSFAAVTGNVITAVYAGDGNWSGSASAPLTLVAATVPTAASLSANLVSALQGANIVFTVRVSDGPTTLFPLPAAPSGVVTFYDSYNGQAVLLGTSTLTTSGPYVATAQVSTTGLFHGLHNVTAYFAGGTTFAASVSNVLPVHVTDYSVAISPQTMTLTRGGSGIATVTLAALDGFTGTVSLACTPPPDTLTSCVFSPVVVPAGGSSTLTIGTTAPRAKELQRAGLGGLAGVSVAVLLGFVLVPRKRRPSLMALLVLCGLMGVAGCGLGGSTTGGGGTTTPTGGSPLGTYLFTVTTSGSDGISTNRHTVQMQVTIQ